MLELVEPAKEKRRPDDRLPEEILLDRPSIVIGPCVSAVYGRTDGRTHYREIDPPIDRPTQSHTAGRSVKADVQLFQGEGTQNTISRKHAQLRIEGDGVVKLEDLVNMYVLCLRRDKLIGKSTN